MQNPYTVGERLPDANPGPVTTYLYKMQSE
jgi:hypothetical protein